jgi:hypothetical protein
MKAHPESVPEFEGLELEKLGMDAFDEDVSVSLKDVEMVLFSNVKVSSVAPIDKLFENINTFDDSVDASRIQERVMHMLDFSIFEDILVKFLNSVHEMIHPDTDIEKIKQVILEKEDSIKSHLFDKHETFFSNFHQNRQELIQSYFANRDKSGINFIFCMTRCLISTYPFKYPRMNKHEISVKNLIQDWLNLSLKNQEIPESMSEVQTFLNHLINAVIKMGKEIKNIFETTSENYPIIQEGVVLSAMTFAKQLKAKVLLELVRLTSKEAKDVEEKLLAYAQTTDQLHSGMKFLVNHSVLMHNVVKVLKYRGMVPFNMHEDYFAAANWLQMDNSELKDDLRGNGILV